MIVSRCLCSHLEKFHGNDRHGRNMCWASPVCGCAQFRRDHTTPAVPDDCPGGDTDTCHYSITHCCKGIA